MTTTRYALLALLLAAFAATASCGRKGDPAAPEPEASAPAAEEEEESKGGAGY